MQKQEACSMTTVFNFGDRKIRTAGTPEAPLFCIGDVCDALDLRSPSQAVERVEQDDIVQVAAENGSQRISYSGPNANAYVTESGLYDLILGSSKGREFKRWVTKDVLPTIRKTGNYLAKPLTQAELIAASANMLVQIERAQAEHERRLANVEAVQAKSASELDDALALPAPPVDASERTYGQMAIALVKSWGNVHSAYDQANRMLYQAVLERPETRIDLRARLEFAKRHKERGKRPKRLCDIIDDSGKAEHVYAIARQLFAGSEARAL